MYVHNFFHVKIALNSHRNRRPVMPSMGQGAERRAAANQTGTGTPKTTIGQRRAGRKRGNDPNGPGRDWNSKIGAKKKTRANEMTTKTNGRVISTCTHAHARAYWHADNDYGVESVESSNGTLAGNSVTRRRDGCWRRTRVLFTPDARPLHAGCASSSRRAPKTLNCAFGNAQPTPY